MMTLLEHRFINRLVKLAVAMCLLCGVHVPAHAQGQRSEARGELLYVTHCSACHSEQVHWRKKKLVTDWSSLLDQVRRWQANIGLDWSEEEIRDAARYLNDAYYRFGINGKKGFSTGSNELPSEWGQK